MTKTIPKCLKTKQVTTKIDPMVAKDVKIFHFKFSKNITKMGDWYENKPSGNPGMRS
jgi:hypothetical protein